MIKIATIFIASLFLVFSLSAQQTRTVYLDELTIQSFSEGIPGVTAKTCAGGDSIRMKGKTYQRGVGVHSTSVLTFQLNGKGLSFSALTGVDDNATPGMVYKMYAIGDEKILFESNPMKVGDAPQMVNVNLKDVKRFGLLVMVKEERGTKTYSNWANATIIMQDTSLPQTVPNEKDRYILTPAPSKTPRLTTPKVYGATPGNPFLFTVTATGERPMKFSASPLPAGLSIDTKTGIITGVLNKKGNYLVTMKAKNNFGAAQKQLTIKIGDTISLTPPIGWNGWNSWARLIDREKVIASANAMVNMGLSKHGWSYINIDDSWQGKREGPDTALQPNAKFPDIKGMVDYIHSLGLKAGLYSTPYVASYGGYVGASSDSVKGGETFEQIKKNKQFYHHIGPYKFEPNDAKQMAKWGFDFLKYDWRIDVASTERMWDALNKSGRDIVLSLSNNAPFEKVNDWNRVSNMYRTGPDIKDSWTSLFLTSFTLDKWAPYSGPGHWMDPDMMIVGNVSIGPILHPTRLTPDEQYSHISMFSLLAAPMLIGCPIEQIDAFTLNLLTNDEVIAVNQDPLGKPARLVKEINGIQIWLKQLLDGSVAVGLFNTGGYGTNPASYFNWGNETAASFNFDFSSIGLNGKYTVRDLWQQKNIGVFNGSMKTTINHHGVQMFQLTSKK